MFLVESSEVKKRLNITINVKDAKVIIQMCFKSKSYNLDKKIMTIMVLQEFRESNEKYW